MKRLSRIAATSLIASIVWILIALLRIAEQLGMSASKALGIPEKVEVIKDEEEKGLVFLFFNAPTQRRQ
jgi:hypothetical protein